MRNTYLSLNSWWGRLGGLALMSAWLAVAGSAQDRVIFSRPDTKIPLPNTGPKEKDLSNLPEFKDHGGSAMDPFVSPPAAPSSSVRFASRRLQDLIDQRKNWIYMTPELQIQSLTGQYGNEVDQSSMNSVNGRPPSLVERHIDNMERRQATTNRPNSDNAYKSNNIEPGYLSGRSTDLGTNGFNSMGSESSLKGMLDRNPLMDSSATSPGRSLLPVDPNGTPFGTVGSVADRLRASRSDNDVRFQHLSRSPLGSISPLGPVDSINLLNEGLRREPGSARTAGLDEMAGTAGTRNPLRDLPSSGLPMLPNAGRLPGELNDRVLGQSSLSPALSSLATPQFQPLPSVLEIPKRRF